MRKTGAKQCRAFLGAHRVPRMARKDTRLTVSTLYLTQLKQTSTQTKKQTNKQTTKETDKLTNEENWSCKDGKEGHLHGLLSPHSTLCHNQSKQTITQNKQKNNNTQTEFQGWQGRTHIGNGSLSPTTLSHNQNKQTNKHLNKGNIQRWQGGRSRRISFSFQHGMSTRERVMHLIIELLFIQMCLNLYIRAAFIK